MGWYFYIPMQIVRNLDFLWKLILGCLDSVQSGKRIYLHVWQTQICLATHWNGWNISMMLLELSLNLFWFLGWRDVNSSVFKMLTTWSNNLKILKYPIWSQHGGSPNVWDFAQKMNTSVGNYGTKYRFQKHFDVTINTDWNQLVNQYPESLHLQNLWR